MELRNTIDERATQESQHPVPIVIEDDGSQSEMLSPMGPDGDKQDEDNTPVAPGGDFGSSSNSDFSNVRVS
jgi:hypothetical protein